jgi:hypothetical protein
MLTTATELAALNSAADAAEPGRPAWIPTGFAFSATLLDWAAARLGDDANVAANDCHLEGRAVTWLTTQEWLPGMGR